MHNSLAHILENWVEQINLDEFYLVHSFDRLLAEKSSSEAYEFIPYIIEAVLLTTDGFLASQLIFYLNCFYGKADTTELHPVLLDKRKELENHISRLKDPDAAREYEELKKELRLK